MNQILTQQVVDQMVTDLQSIDATRLLPGESIALGRCIDTLTNTLEELDALPKITTVRNTLKTQNLMGKRSLGNGYSVNPGPGNR